MLLPIWFDAEFRVLFRQSSLFHVPLAILMKTLLACCLAGSMSAMMASRGFIICPDSTHCHCHTNQTTTHWNKGKGLGESSCKPKLLTNLHISHWPLETAPLLPTELSIVECTRLHCGFPFTAQLPITAGCQGRQRLLWNVVFADDQRSLLQF